MIKNTIRTVAVAAAVALMAAAFRFAQLQR